MYLPSLPVLMCSSSCVFQKGCQLLYYMCYGVLVHDMEGDMLMLCLEVLLLNPMTLLHRKIL